MRAFLKGTKGSIIRSFSVINYKGWGDQHRLVTDACPGGMGGVFLINNWIVAWFAVASEQFDWNSSAIRQASMRVNRPEKHGQSELA